MNDKCLGSKNFSSPSRPASGPGASLIIVVLAALIPSACWSQTSQEELDGWIEDWDRRYRAETMLHLLSNEQYRDSLVLDESQATDIDQLKAQYWSESQVLRELFPVHDKLKPLEDPELERARMDFMKMRARKDEALLVSIAGKMEKVLLPHQLVLARQTTIRNFFSNNGTGGASIIPLVMAAELDLTDSERKKLKEAIERTRKSHERDLRLARERAAKIVEDALSPGQVSTLHEKAGVDWYQPVLVK